MKLIQTFADGSQLTFDSGSFDDWCVYLKRPNQSRYAPRDVAYFTRLNELGSIYGHQKIYDDFVAFYLATSKNIDTTVLVLINKISLAYSNHSLEMEILFAIIYAGMIAEENKEHAVLKKRIKRLGMHQTLIERLSPVVAANFSRGKKWKELDLICQNKNF